MLDPFCGSGTTLVEALLLKDSHCLSVLMQILCLISLHLKTAYVGEQDIEQLRKLEVQTTNLAHHLACGGLHLFSNNNLGVVALLFNDLIFRD